MELLKYLPKIKLYISKYWLFVIFLLFFFILCIYFIYTMSLSKKNKSYLKDLTSGKNNMRIFTIHYLENFIYVVDKKNFKGKKKQTFKWFYNSFTNEDSLRVKVWINEIIRNDRSVKNNLEVHTLIKKSRTPIFSILTCTGIDRKSGLIHIESHLFPRIRKNRIIYKEDNSIISYNEMINLIDKSKKGKLNLFLIKLFTIDSSKKKNSLSNKVLMTTIMSHTKELLKKNMIMTLSDQNEILILETRARGKSKSISFAHDLSLVVLKLLYLNSVHEAFQYRISIATKKNEIQKFNSLIEQSRKMVDDSQENNHQVIIYNSTINNDDNNNQIVSEKIKYIIKNEMVNIQYTPLVNCTNGHIGGFNTDIIVKSNLFNSFVEIEDNAANYGLIHDLLSMVYYKINDVYINKYFITTEKRRLFMDVKIQFYKEIISIVESIETPENVKTIFVLNDKDINKEAMSNNKFLMNALEELNKYPNIRLGLEFTSTSLEINSEILKKFNYFIFDYKESFANLFSSTQDQILLQSLVNTLMGYSQIQLTALNLTSWQAIDYFSSLGFKYVSGPYFGQEVNKLPSIETKKINKLLSLNE